VGDKPMGLGPIQGGAMEQSNVDLSTELVALIEQQRNYQASAQTFKILDQVLQNLGNIR
jgi:flagellar hook protein FlgE